MSAWRSRLLREGPALALLAGISVVALVLRYQHLDYGLPYVYNQDEGSHFTSRAVAMFGGDPDPGYFQNPSAFTYLVHVALRFKYGGWWPFGNFDDVIQHFARDPSGIYVAARRVAAVLGVAGAVAVYSVGRRLWDRRTGLVAAAVIAFAFLPVTYSRIALTDVGVLVPVALVLLFAVRIQETGSLRWCAAAGAAAGVAIGFKYTAGLVLLAPLAALALRREWRGAALGGLVVLAVALVAFFITTPFFFIDLSDARRQLGAQTDRANGQPKFGQTGSDGFTYYLGSLTWGLGWLALLAAVAGGVIVARRDRARAVVLLIFPLALFVYLSLQARFFGRWLLPAYPVFALLAGVAVTTAAAWLRERAPRLELPAVALGAAAARVAVGRRGRALDGGARQPRHPRGGARVARGPHQAGGARDHRAGRPGALLPPAPDQALAAGVREPVRPGRAADADRVRRHAEPARDRPVPRAGLLHRGDDEPDRGAQRRGEGSGRAGLLRAPEARVEARLLRQPVPVRQEAAAVRLRPLLQLLLGRLPAARAEGRRLPPEQLQAALRRRREPAGGGGMRAWWVLGAIVVLALALRLWHLDHGLPYAYNADEELHFVPVAVKMFGGSLNPRYFENPPALTYLLFLVFKLRFGFGRDLIAQFRADPEAAYLTARVVVALIGTLVVGLVYWAGARFSDRRAGLAAAALMAVAFLPVFYSKHALNDVVTMAPVTVALVACLLVYEQGRWGHWVLAGAAIGVAIATKYTAGAMLVTLGVAAVLRVLADRGELRRALLGLVAAGAACGVAFALLNPFAIIEHSTALGQIGGQSGQAASGKLGQDQVTGWWYYLRTFTWGLGWLPAVAALAGGVLMLWRDWRRGLLLVVFPLFLFLFLGHEARFFGRWLLPAYPALCVLAGYAVWVAAEQLRAPRARLGALVVLVVALCAQGLRVERAPRPRARARGHARAGQALARRPRPGPRGRRDRAVRAGRLPAPRAGRDARLAALPGQAPVPGLREEAAPGARASATSATATAGSWSAATRRGAA